MEPSIRYSVAITAPDPSFQSRTNRFRNMRFLHQKSGGEQLQTSTRAQGRTIRGAWRYRVARGYQKWFEYEAHRASRHGTCKRNALLDVTSHWRRVLTERWGGYLMRAILRTGFGGPDVLVIREIPEPEP